MEEIVVTVWLQDDCSSKPPVEVPIRPSRTTVEQVTLKAAERLGVKDQGKVWTLLLRGKFPITEVEDIRDRDILYLKECIKQECIKKEENKEEHESEDPGGGEHRPALKKRKQEPSPENEPTRTESSSSPSLKPSNSPCAEPSTKTCSSLTSYLPVVTRDSSNEPRVKLSSSSSSSSSYELRVSPSGALIAQPSTSRSSKDNVLSLSHEVPGVIYVVESVDFAGGNVTRLGADDATGKLFWEQYDTGKKWEGREDILNIEIFSRSAVEPKLRRVRKGWAIVRVPNTSIVDDCENQWFQAQGEESRKKVAGYFGILPRKLVEQIFTMAIARPTDHYMLATCCKEFRIGCEARRVVVHTACVATQAARNAKVQAEKIAKNAHGMALEKGSKRIKFETGEWRGQKSRAMEPSGLGRYTDTKGVSSAGTFKFGLEEGPCAMNYDDGSSYFGEFKKGNRDGHGIQWTGHGQRYEGPWNEDKRHGYALLIGGPWPYVFGRYVEDQPVGLHIAWNNITDTVTLRF